MQKRTKKNIYLTIIIPVYNEEKTISKLLTQINKIRFPYFYQTIVINDGSKDKTSLLLKQNQSKYNFLLLNNRQNIGKGSSIRKALKYARGKIILFQDGDNEYDPKEIPKLIKLFDQKAVQVVYGSRMLIQNPQSHWAFYFGGRLLSFLTNILYFAQITDEPTGYKAIRKSLLNRLKLNATGFEICPEVTAKILKLGIRIYELPIHYYPRPVSEKKINWKDGLKAIYYLIKYRFTN